jgi:heme-degrading monooxygenase HmoA
MYARTITAALVPGKGDEAIRIFRDGIVPIIRDQPGYISTSIYLNRDKNIAQTVSLWESAEHEKATSEGTEYLSKVVGLLRGCLVNKEHLHWEVGHYDHI